MIQSNYIPWPKQRLFHESPANEIVYGGAAGPGKSHAIRHELFTWCMRIPGLQAYLFRRTYPELEKNHILPSLHEFPDEVGKYKDQKRRWEFHNDSMLHFSYAQYEKDVFAFLSAEFHILGIDELTTFTEFMYDFLRARVRCPMDIPEKYRHKIPGIYSGTNPGGIGHEFVKFRWVDKDPSGEMKLLRAPKNEGGMLRQYIPGLLKDNPTLTDNDPGYEDRLDALPEPYRTAYKTGNWEIFINQAFLLTNGHMIDPMPVPEFAPLEMTFDSGYGAPFSIGWWWIDADNRIYRFNEWYGWNGTPNQGMRLTDSEVAQGIIEREKRLGIHDRPIRRIGDRWCFQKKPDYKGGGQGPSTAEVFENCGLKLERGDDISPESRRTKIRQFRERLKVPEDGSPPGMLIYKSCEQFLRTIKILQVDPLNVEDIDTNMEDHAYDESCLICMDRPMGISDEQVKKLIKKQEIQAQRKKLDTVSQKAWEEVDKTKERIDEEWEYEEEAGGIDFSAIG